MKFLKIIWGSSYGLGKYRGNKKAFYIIYPKLTIYFRLQFIFFSNKVLGGFLFIREILPEQNFLID